MRTSKQDRTTPLSLDGKKRKASPADATRPAAVADSGVERVVAFGADTGFGGVVLVLQLEGGVRLAVLFPPGDAYAAGNRLAVLGAQAAETNRIAEGDVPEGIDSVAPGASDPAAAARLAAEQRKALEGRTDFNAKRLERQRKLLGHE